MAKQEDSELGKRVARARLILGAHFGVTISQGAFALLVDVTQKSVSRWESGEKPPSRANVKLVAKVSGVDPGWLLSGVGTPGDGTGTSVSLRNVQSAIQRAKATQKAASENKLKRSKGARGMDAIAEVLSPKGSKKKGGESA